MFHAEFVLHKQRFQYYLTEDETLKLVRGTLQIPLCDFFPVGREISVYTGASVDIDHSLRC